MAADYEKTSFGIRQTVELADKLEPVRKLVEERSTFITDPAKVRRLEILLAAIAWVQKDLN